MIYNVRSYKNIAIRIIYCVVVYYYLNIISSVLKDRLTTFFISFIDCFIFTVGTYIFLLVICDLFNCWKVFLCRIEVINSYLIHSYIHDWRIGSLVGTIMSWKIWMTVRWARIVLADTSRDEAITTLFLNFLHWLENWR